MPAGQHIFRINTSASYVEFPAGSPTAATAANADGKQVVWTDLNAACGQCHGGDAGSTATKNGAPYFPTSTLSQAAAVMHPTNVNGSPVLPAGAGVGSCGPVGFVLPTSGSQSTNFVVSDTSTFNGGLAGTVYIDWGDGSAMTKMAPGATAGHTYANNGGYTIRKTTQDNQFGFNCVEKASVTVSNLATGGFGSASVTADACGTTTAMANVNVYMTSGFLQFHGDTSASGTVTLGSVANTMPVGSYTVAVYGPQTDGLTPPTALCTYPQTMKCFSDSACGLPVTSPFSVTGLLTPYQVYCGCK